MSTLYQMDWHSGHEYPEWGSAPRGPLVTLDMAHQGELMGAVVGPDVATGTPMPYHVVRCELCIGIHVWPLPSPETLKRYYSEQFYQVEKPEYLERYERDREWWLKCVHWPLLIDALMALGSHRPHTELSMLEIGAGPGLALEAAQLLGLQTYAIEPSPVCAHRLHALGYSVWQGTLEDFPVSFHQYQSQRFDILYLYEVLEHQPCPEDFLLRCYDLLAPGGVLVCVVPNDFNPLQLESCRRFNLSRYWLAPPQHLWYFTPKCLQLLVRRCGFMQVDMRGSYPLESFMLDEELIYVGNDELGRKIHQVRMSMELSSVSCGQWDKVEDAYRANMSQRLGREIVSIWRKPVT